VRTLFVIIAIGRFVMTASILRGASPWRVNNHTTVR